MICYYCDSRYSIREMAGAQNINGKWACQECYERIDEIRRKAIAEAVKIAQALEKKKEVKD